ncbi:hypothetical protein N7461_003713 [Penicillium sp. DV-2018c]|nr:hypothetical protein N7461_003713 [Penicillium sp. DV-2018c]
MNAPAFVMAFPVDEVLSAHVFCFSSSRARTQTQTHTGISLILSALSLGVSVASWLLPAKEWLGNWFPRLWPQSGQQNQPSPIMLEEGSVVVSGRELADVRPRLADLERQTSVGRVQTLDPPQGVDQAGPSDESRMLGRTLSQSHSREVTE